MPLQHSENLADQERSVAEFQRLGEEEGLRYALLHRDQIRRFGRFPGRNRALGRAQHGGGAAGNRAGRDVLAPQLGYHCGYPSD